MSGYSLLSTISFLLDIDLSIDNNQFDVVQTMSHTEISGIGNRFSLFLPRLSQFRVSREAGRV